MSQDSTHQEPESESEADERLTSRDLFAEVEAQRSYFALERTWLHANPLAPDNRMVWHCRCAAPEKFAVYAESAPEAIQKALDRAKEISSANACLSHGDGSATPTAPTSNQSK